MNNLLIAWCALLLAPGALDAAGALGHHGPIVFTRHSATPSGALVAAWIVGYMAQLFVFMALMRAVGEMRVLWWFVASLLPWICDWSAAVSYEYFLLCLAATAAVAWWIASVAGAARFMTEHGLRASGEVLEVIEPLMNVVINNVYIRRTVRLRIARDDGAPAYEARLKGTFMLGEIPKVGDRLRVLVDPNRPQHLVPDDSKSTRAPAQPAEPHPQPRSHAAPSNIAEELEKLANLHSRGVLDAAELAAAKKKLLGD
ncbi:MAG TPA: hypothetical protein VFF06_31580 [Polyangia bacterium]|nr:hypothetical protein [Polyangia bacterium]